MKQSLNWRRMSSHKHLLVIAGYALLLAIFISLGWRSARQLDAEIDAQRWVNHSYQVLLELNGLLSDLKDAETGTRGFLITGQEQYLQPYTTALTTINQRWNTLQQSLTADDTRQHARLGDMAPLIDGKLAELQRSIELRRKAGFDAAAAAVLTHTGKELMDQLRQLVATTQIEEHALLSQRAGTMLAHRKKLKLLLLLGTLAGVGLLGVLALVVSQGAAETAKTNRTVSSRYGVAVALGGLICLLLWLLNPLYGGHAQPLVVINLAVAAAAWWGGLGPGLLATALCTAFSWWALILPVYSCKILDLQESLHLLFAVFTGAVISALAEAMHRGAGRQRQADELARANADRLQFALEIIQTGAWELDLVDNTSVRSLDHDRIFGYAALRPRWTYEMFLDHVLPADRAMVDSHFRRAVATKGDWNFECRICRPDGAIRWIMAAGRHCADATGGLRHIAGVVQDITARKQAEAALRDREEQLRLFAEHAPAAIAMFDAQMRYIATSQRWLADYGLAGQDLRGRSHYELFPEIPARWREIHRRCLAGAVERADDDPFVRADGQTQWIRWEIRPWRTAAGAVGGIIIFSEDVTARKLAEEQLRLVSAALEAAANAITITDRHGTIQWVNTAFTQLTGYSRAAAIGQNPRLLKSGQHPSEFYAGMWSTINAGHVWHGELINQRQDGSLYPEDMTITPVRASDGAITHFVAIKQDITTRHQTEQALRTSQARLEQQVAERTVALRATVEELEHFSYSIAHDMRAPLRALRSYAELILKQPGAMSPTHCDYLGRIATSAKQMDDLILDALAYSKAVRTELPLSPVDPAAVLRTILDTYPGFQPAKADIRIDGVLPCVIANPTGLLQCFSNLLYNAVKFVAPGVLPQVRVSAEIRNGRVRLCFADNGIGIPAEFRGRLFKMFERASRDYDGTGIGLALVRKVSERMHGAVGADSEPGRGSRFWLEFDGASIKLGH